jgi:hypothetical protein
LKDEITYTGNSKRSPGGTRKPHLKLSYLRLFNSWRGRLLAYCCVLAVIFSAIGLVQHWFIHREVERAAIQELAAWAEKVGAEIAYRRKWDLSGYRNAAISCPSWYVVAQDGLVVDIEGDIPWVFGRVEIINDFIYGSPQTVVSSVGETWRLLAKKLDGGIVILGIVSPQTMREADRELVKNIRKFGSTLKKASSTQSREIDWDVDYAVLRSTGEIESAFGGVPLRARLDELPVIVGKKGTVIVSHSGNSYRLYSQPILDANRRPVGTIIVPQDMTLEQEAMHLQDLFNILLVVFSLVVSFALATVFAAGVFSGRRSTLSVEEALRVGESKTVEFKSTLYWDTKLRQQKEERRLDILRAIGGFLNTDGGNLYIGVSEDQSGRPVLRGVDEDLKLMHNSEDKLQRSLRDLITTRIGAEFSPFITDRIERVQDKLCWIVTVDPSPTPVFVRWKAAGESKEQKKFFVREGPKTSDLDNERTWRYIKNKWG